MNYTFKSFTISDHKNKLIRKINLTNEYYLIGDVEERKTKDKDTSNALGKTTFIQMLSYCLCGNIIAPLKPLINYRLILELEKGDSLITVERIIGNTNVWINNQRYTLNLAQEALEISRIKLNHMIHANERDSIILDSPNKFDLYQAAYELLGLQDLCKLTSEFYEFSNEKTKLDERIKQLQGMISSEEHLELNNTRIKNLREKLDKIQNLDEKEIIRQNDDLYSEQNNLKTAHNYLLSNKFEYEDRIKIIDSYLHDLSDIPENILEFISQANNELGQFIKAKIEDILAYHNELRIERSTLLVEEKANIKKDLASINKDLDVICNKLPSLKSIIKEKNELTRVFQVQNKLHEEINSLEKENHVLAELTEARKIIDQNKKEKYNTYLALKETNIAELNKTYVEYSNQLVSQLYPESYKSSFSINIIDSRNVNRAKYPVLFDFKISKDDSEGVRNTRNMIVDLIMLKYSNEIPFMIWDSKAFNGIDPQQLRKLFVEIKDIALETHKQVIVCFNSFQIQPYFSDLFDDEFIKENALILTLENTLLGIDF